MLSYKNYILQLVKCLEMMVASDVQNKILTCEEGMTLWCQMTKVLKDNNNTIFFIGNGASAMMASHMAADASKNGCIRALAFNDPALLTAVSNDISYDNSFSLPLKRFAKCHDHLVTISSSGNSLNIIAAIKVARDMNLKVITLSGMTSNNHSRQAGDLNIYVPATTYGLVEAAHQAILHCWLDLFMDTYKEDCQCLK